MMNENFTTPEKVKVEWPYSDEVDINHLYIPGSHALAQQFLAMPEGSSQRNEVIAAYSQLWLQAEKEGRWWYGPTRDRASHPDHIEAEKSDTDDDFSWLEDLAAASATQEPANEPVADQPADEPPAPAPEPAKKKGWLRANWDAFREYASRHKVDAALMVALGGAFGVLSVGIGESAAAAISKNLFESGAAPLANWLGTVIAGGVTTLLVNNGLFLSLLTKRVLLPGSRGVRSSILHKENPQLSPEQVEQTILADEKGMMGSVVVGDIAGKVAALGYKIAAGVIPGLKQAIELTRHAPVTHTPDIHGGPMDLTHPAPTPAPLEAPQVPGADTLGIPGQTIPLTPPLETLTPPPVEHLLPPAGQDYIIQPNDGGMYKVLEQLIKPMPHHSVYDSPKVLEFLKLNEQTLIDAWAKTYGERGGLVRNYDGTFIRLSTEQFKQLVRTVIERGLSPEKAWDATGIRFTDVSNALQVPPGTHVILPVPEGQ